MQDLIKTLWRDDSGRDTTEYVLLVLLVAFAVTAMLLLADGTNSTQYADNLPSGEPASWRP